MVSYNTYYRPIYGGKLYFEGECLSTDTKPTDGIMNGSKLLEIDTSTLYIYDQENGEWRVFS